MAYLKPFTTEQINDLTTSITPNSVYSHGTFPTVSIGDITTSLTSGTATTYTMSGALGSSNQPNTVWTSTGTGSVIGGLGLTPTTIDSGGKIKLTGDNADVDINGKSLKLWMEKVEERLNILTPNTELEKEWEELRRLGERYRKLEKKCKEKSDVWNKLKAMPPQKMG